MKVGIYKLKDLNLKDLAVLCAYSETLAFNGIQFIRLRVEEERYWDQVKDLSLFIMRFQHDDVSKQLARDILPVVEKEMGIPCYPNWVSAWHYDDKVKQYYLMRANGFPMTKSWIFYDKKKAQDWDQTAEYPLVFKSRAGAGSMNVILVESPTEDQKLIKRVFGSGLVDFNQDQIDLRCVEIALEVSREMGFPSTAYDFMYNEKGEPKFCEISYNYGCPGYRDKDLTWHEGHYWPEYLHLMDGLDLPDLKIPETDFREMFK